MKKFINFFLIILIFLFFFNIYKYYSSYQNVKNTNLNRIDIEEIIQNKISSLKTLKNDTDNVIKFNNSFGENIQKDQKRSFWNLLKFK